ncbi:MAG: hypothetical protein O6952_08555 [Planctomycetota bacterium]|nr:hypothetical protein [Planctomycetota bacterium]
MSDHSAVSCGTTAEAENQRDIASSEPTERRERFLVLGIFTRVAGYAGALAPMWAWQDESVARTR